MILFSFFPVYFFHQSLDSPFRWNYRWNNSRRRVGCDRRQRHRLRRHVCSGHPVALLHGGVCRARRADPDYPFSHHGSLCQRAVRANHHGRLDGSRHAAQPGEEHPRTGHRGRRDWRNGLARVGVWPLRCRSPGAVWLAGGLLLFDCVASGRVALPDQVDLPGDSSLDAETAAEKVVPFSRAAAAFEVCFHLKMLSNKSRTKFQALKYKMCFALKKKNFNSKRNPESFIVEFLMSCAVLSMWRFFRRKMACCSIYGDFSFFFQEWTFDVGKIGFENRPGREEDWPGHFVHQRRQNRFFARLIFPRARVLFGRFSFWLFLTFWLDYFRLCAHILRHLFYDRLCKFSGVGWFFSKHCLFCRHLLIAGTCWCWSFSHCGFFVIAVFFCFCVRLFTST